MAIYFGLNESTASSLFSSFSNVSSGASSLLSNYASIKNGSYHKLLKAYYSQVSDSAGNSTPIKDKLDSDSTAWKDVASDISSLKSSAGTLIQGEVTEENRSKLEKNISDFVKSYNSVLDSSSEVTSSSLSKKAEWMNRITDNHSSALEKVGITIKEDNTLSLDSEALSKASLDDLKSVFSGSYSYAGQINSAANLMAQVAANGGNSNTASLYTRSGTYNNVSVSPMYNMFF